MGSALFVLAGFVGYWLYSLDWHSPAEVNDPFSADLAVKYNNL